MNRNDEQLEDHLRRQFNELDTLPTKDKRRIIFFALLGAELAALISPSGVNVLLAVEKVIGLREFETAQGIMSRLVELSEKTDQPTLRELQYIGLVQKIYLQFENLSDDWPESLFP